MNVFVDEYIKEVAGNWAALRSKGIAKLTGEEGYHKDISTLLYQGNLVEPLAKVDHSKAGILGVQPP